MVNSKMTVMQHADELRSRFLKILVCFLVCFILTYCFIDDVLDFVIKPVGDLVFTAPSDAFFARIMLAILGGVLLSLPLIIFQIWQFVVLGLKDKEIQNVKFYMPFSLILFFMGVSFSYCVVIPVALKFLLGFSTDTIHPMITIKNYVSFVGTLVLVFGIIFELPLVLLFLSHIGVATVEFLEQKRRFAILIIIVISSLITPPDFLTQIMMAGPLIILYEIGILCIKVFNKKR